MFTSELRFTQANPVCPQNIMARKLTESRPYKEFSSQTMTKSKKQGVTIAQGITSLPQIPGNEVQDYTKWRPTGPIIKKRYYRP